jgi:F-type H+-transporting ATPase subunit a
MPEPTTTPPPVPPAAGIAETLGVEGMKHAESEAAAQDQAAHHHTFNFDALNASHTMPYPAIEPIHGHPLLILNLAEYADINYASLSASPEFAAASAADHEGWAKTYVARKETFKDDAGNLKHFPTTSANLAKAMTVARHDAAIGTFPEALGFLNQQTFWSSIALILGALAMLVFARRKPDQYKPAGRFQHMLEAIVLYVRNDIVRVSIKSHADWWTPFFASLFLVILTCNLVGLIPVCATATGNIAVTAAFALVTGFLMFFMGIKEQGLVHFVVTLAPVKWSWNPMAMLLWLFLWVLEAAQLIIRPTVLAIRLTVNMFAGHSVLLVFASLGFIIFATDHHAIVLASGLGAAGWVLLIFLYALELLVALLQAYIFTLLSAVFIGLCAHPEH